MKVKTPSSTPRKPMQVTPPNRLFGTEYWRLAAMVLMGLAHQSPAQTYSLTNVWQATNSTPGAHLATIDVNRGLAYSAVSNQVFVCNKGVTGSGTTPAIDVFNGASGALVGNVNVSSLSGGTFRLDQAAVADDG